MKIHCMSMNVQNVPILLIGKWQEALPGDACDRRCAIGWRERGGTRFRRPPDDHPPVLQSDLPADTRARPPASARVLHARHDPFVQFVLRSCLITTSSVFQTNLLIIQYVMYSFL